MLAKKSLTCSTVLVVTFLLGVLISLAAQRLGIEPFRQQPNYSEIRARVVSNRLSHINMQQEHCYDAVFLGDSLTGQAN